MRVYDTLTHFYPQPGPFMTHVPASTALIAERSSKLSVYKILIPLALRKEPLSCLLIPCCVLINRISIHWGAECTELDCPLCDRSILKEFLVAWWRVSIVCDCVSWGRGRVGKGGDVAGMEQTAGGPTFDPVLERDSGLSGNTILPAYSPRWLPAAPHNAALW